MNKLMILIAIVLMVLAFGIMFFFIAGGDNPDTARILESMFCKSGEKITQETSIVFSSSSGSGRNTMFYCELEPGQRRDITGQYVLALIGGFIIPFLLGLFLFIATTTRSARRFARNLGTQTTQFTLSGGYANPRVQNTVIDLRGGQSLDSTQIPPQAKEALENFFGNNTAWTGSSSSPIGNSDLVSNLTEKLERFEKEHPDKLSPHTKQMLENLLKDQAIWTGQMGASSSTLVEKLQQLEDARSKGLINDAEYEQARKSILDHFDN